MSKYKKLLNQWCQYLVSQQITDENSDFFGGFNCSSCVTIHGRADNAIFPLVLEYSLTKDSAFLSAAERLLSFRALLSHEDGSVQNDFGSEWKGITAFSVINLLKTLKFFSDILPAEFKTELEKCAKDGAIWVYDTIDIGFRANVNYYAAASTVNALYYELYSDESYKEKAEKLLSYCLNLFTENGLLTGEGQPHDFRTEKGCAPVDIGYNVEESLPCLVETALVLDDTDALEVLAENGRKLLEFMLPDGGWDNSFGVRNNKWTYYGSRTSDGCIGAFVVLGRYDEIFLEAAERTFEILEKCTENGALYGGLMYAENGQKPCVHHTFCHACALADALLYGYNGTEKRLQLPCDKTEIGYKYYPELDSYKINTGSFLGTITAYNYSTYTYTRGAAHSSGGTLSLLYKKGAGALIAGSVYDYKLTEPFNMQNAENVLHESLIVRAEYEQGGVKFASCLDKNADVKVVQNGDVIRVEVKAKLCSIEDESFEDITAEFSYIFRTDSVEISAKKLDERIKFVLPVIDGKRTVETKNKYNKENIFFLTGGFSAEKFSFSLDEDVSVRIR